MNDFAVRYDPIHQVLSVNPARSEDLLPIRLRLDALREMGLPDAAKWIGQIFIFSVPELCAVFLPQTKAPRPAIEFIDELIEAFAQQDSKSADDLFEMAMLYLVRGRFSSSEDDLLRADLLVRDAAKAGNKKASDVLASDWTEVIRTHKPTRSAP